MAGQVLEHCPTDNREPLRGLVASHIGPITWRTVSKCVLNGEAIEDGVSAACAKDQGTLTFMRKMSEVLSSPPPSSHESPFTPALQGGTIVLSDKVVFLPLMPPHYFLFPDSKKHFPHT